MVLMVTDADNTLWDTNAIFATAQLALLAQIEMRLQRTATAANRLSFVRAIDQRLAILHEDELGYPPEMLVLGIIEAIEGVSPNQAAQKVFAGSVSNRMLPTEEMAYHFLDQVRRLVPELRTGVMEGIPQLHQKNVVLVVATEGNADRCRSLLDYYKLSSYVTEVFEGKKMSSFFSDIASVYGKPTIRLAVGDQLDRDIAPAQTAGFRTIYFPGEFKPEWEGLVSVCPDYTVSSFSEVCSVVDLYRMGLS